MLSIKNLVKVYKTKGGAEVRALDGVSVDFPEKGMVFLLGKSGSGKSTLLNVAGGLDRPDSGEVIVKGKSSKSFSAADFDSYRNTYVGFVFQEYNILDEFNIEQNIALALQLQGKKNDKEAVNALLAQVDLAGLGKRKPNTLSGGQKQRVAIARALIKEPEIIMADEPTGALDSNTGKQVFDTLKKLSSDKLVIVVSHDREFAEQYADRIIELKDGKILSDTSKALAAPKSLSANVNAIGDDTVRVADWNKLTQDDFNQIWSMMKGRNGEVIITSSETDMPAIKRVCKIADDGSKEYFKDTDRSAVKVGQYDASRTKFIKSKMPMSRAVKMGASGLKTKPVRLFFTILLSVLSFAMFGVLSTMMMYDPIYSVASALESSPYKTAMLTKNYNYHYRSYSEDKDGNREYYNEDDSSRTTMFGKSEVETLNQNSEGLRFAGVISSIYGNSSSYADQLGSRSNSGTYYSALSYSFTGFTDCGDQFMSDNGFSCLAGKYPEKVDEIAVSNYVYEAFEKFGYVYDGKSSTISSASDLVGKKIAMTVGNKGYKTTEFTITAVYDTGSLSEYEELKKTDSNLSPDDIQTLEETFFDVMKTGFQGLGYVSDAFYDKYADDFKENNNGVAFQPDYAYGMRVSDYEIKDSVEEYVMHNYYSPRKVKDNATDFKLYTADGTVVSAASFTLGENEAYIPLRDVFDDASILYNSGNEYFNIYLDAEGKQREVLQGENAYSDFFYTNYDGDVSLTEKSGYGKINGSGWISKTGEVTSNHPGIDHWQTYDYDNAIYYENSLGELTKNAENFVTKADVYYTDKDGKRYPDYQGEFTEVRAECFITNDRSEVYLKSDLPETYFIEKSGAHYVMNDTGKIVFENPIKDWRLVDGFYLDYHGNVVTEDMSEYHEEKAYLYFNENGDQYSFTPQEDFNRYSEYYYVGENGKVSLDWFENATQKRGLYVNESGDISITHKTGYIFTDHYYKNDTTGDIKFATWYYNLRLDSDGNAMFDPENGLVNQGNRRKTYSEYAENADYAAAFLRLAKACLSDIDYDNFGFDDTGVGEMTDADVALIMARIERDYAAWCGREFEKTSLYAKNANGDTETLQIKGYYNIKDNYDMYYILSDVFTSRFQVVPKNFGENTIWGQETTTDYIEPADARYNIIVTLTNNTQSQTHFMLDERENGVVFYSMNNRVYQEANSMASMIEMLSLVFLIAGAVMAVLSALMLFNFISASISAKRKEIGILRAVGARGKDVFKIFFSEALIIALICFVLSAVAAGVACFIMNGVFASAVAISLLNYGIVQILLILGIALVVSFIATILPVYFAAKKPPVESIRAL